MLLFHSFMGGGQHGDGDSETVGDAVRLPRAAGLMSLLDDKESKDWLQGIVDSAADAIIAMDEQQHIVLFNRSAAIIFMLPQDEAIGKPFSALMTFAADHTAVGR